MALRQFLIGEKTERDVLEKGDVKKIVKNFPMAYINPNGKLSLIILNYASLYNT